MARLSRAFVDHGCYHITSRGNQQREVFKERGDYIKYLDILERAKKKYEIMLYAYCLMPNHAHLLIELNRARAMSKFMHWLNRGYSAYFNTKYEMVGHIWQGRFKSKPILKDRYLINSATYIEENPVRANMVNDIAEYEWSSYRERCLLSSKIILDDLKIEVISTCLGTL